ncbi:hypothetical protein PMIN07_002535 [Paraphaeosphaeria minitans]
MSDALALQTYKPKAESAPVDPDRPSFLTLPGELRNVYKYAFVFPASLKIARSTKDNEVHLYHLVGDDNEKAFGGWTGDAIRLAPCGTDNVEISRYMGNCFTPDTGFVWETHDLVRVHITTLPLAYTCRQVYKEAMSVLHGDLNFFIMMHVGRVIVSVAPLSRPDDRAERHLSLPQVNVSGYKYTYFHDNHGASLVAAAYWIRKLGSMAYAGLNKVTVDLGTIFPRFYTGAENFFGSAIMPGSRLRWEPLMDLTALTLMSWDQVSSFDICFVDSPNRSNCHYTQSIDFSKLNDTVRRLREDELGLKKSRLVIGRIGVNVGGDAGVVLLKTTNNHGTIPNSEGEVQLPCMVPSYKDWSYDRHGYYHSCPQTYRDFDHNGLGLVWNLDKNAATPKMLELPEPVLKSIAMYQICPQGYLSIDLDRETVLEEIEPSVSSCTNLIHKSRLWHTRPLKLTCTSHASYTSFSGFVSIRRWLSMVGGMTALGRVQGLRIHLDLELEKRVSPKDVRIDASDLIWATAPISHSIGDKDVEIVISIRTRKGKASGNRIEHVVKLQSLRFCVLSALHAIISHIEPNTVPEYPQCGEIDPLCWEYGRIGPTYPHIWMDGLGQVCLGWTKDTAVADMSRYCVQTYSTIALCTYLQMVNSMSWQVAEWAAAYARFGPYDPYYRRDCACNMAVMDAVTEQQDKQAREQNTWGRKRLHQQHYDQISAEGWPENAGRSDHRMKRR